MVKLLCLLIFELVMHSQYIIFSRNISSSVNIKITLENKGGDWS